MFQFAKGFFAPKPNPWKEAVIDACVINCIDWDESDPRGTLAKLIAWEMQLTLDPQVSEEAKKLIQETATAATTLTLSISEPLLRERQRQINMLEHDMRVRGEYIESLQAEIKAAGERITQLTSLLAEALKTASNQQLRAEQLKVAAEKPQNDKPKKPILCLDFDGVLHSYSSGWKGADVIPDPPVPGAIEFLYAAIEQFDVQIYSSRSSQPGGIAAMQAWLDKYDAACWEGKPIRPRTALILCIKFPVEKPPALVGIDDRVITFTGNWPSIEELKAFKPWNQRKESAK